MRIFGGFVFFLLTADFSYSLVSEMTDVPLAQIYIHYIHILLYFRVRSCEKGDS